MSNESNTNKNLEKLLDLITDQLGDIPSAISDVSRSMPGSFNDSELKIHNGWLDHIDTKLIRIHGVLEDMLSAYCKVNRIKSGDLK